MKEVWEEREIMKYSCHAGIMETILPIIYEGILIAYLQIGQFKDEEQIYSSVQKIKDSAIKYGLNTYLFDGDAKKLEAYLDTIL
jgi:ligand-binding sensor protein